MGKPVDRSEVFTAAGSRPIQLTGRFLRVLAADASGVTVTPAGGTPLLRYAGQDIDAGAIVQSWHIAVTVASTVTVCVSDQRQASNTTAVNATISATITPGGTMNQPGDVNCPNGGATQVIAGNANRLTVGVRAPSSGSWASGTVRIGTTAVGAASGIEFNPGDERAGDYTGPIFVYNNSGAAIAVQVLEVAK